ncbi:MAG: hypothetical protein ACTSYX_04910 [Candidatus Thorarchaeota archaeon]
MYASVNVIVTQEFEIAWKANSAEPAKRWSTRCEVFQDFGDDYRRMFYFVANATDEKIARYHLDAARDIAVRLREVFDDIAGLVTAEDDEEQ